MDSKGRGKTGQRLHGGQMAGTEIANEETAFGNSVKTSGTFVPYLTPHLRDKQVGCPKRSVCAFRTVAPYPERRGGG